MIGFLPIGCVAADQPRHRSLDAAGVALLTGHKTILKNIQHTDELNIAAAL
jgi:hypothetical protein